MSKQAQYEHPGYTPPCPNCDEGVLRPIDDMGETCEDTNDPNFDGWECDECLYFKPGKDIPKEAQADDYRGLTMHSPIEDVKRVLKEFFAEQGVTTLQEAARALVFNSCFDDEVYDSIANAGLDSEAVLTECLPSKTAQYEDRDPAEFGEADLAEMLDGTYEEDPSPYTIEIELKVGGGSIVGGTWEEACKAIGDLHLPPGDAVGTKYERDMGDHWVTITKNAKNQTQDDIRTSSSTDWLIEAGSEAKAETDGLTVESVAKTIIAGMSVSELADARKAKNVAEQVLQSRFASVTRARRNTSDILRTVESYRRKEFNKVVSSQVERTASIGFPEDETLFL